MKLHLDFLGPSIITLQTEVIIFSLELLDIILKNSSYAITCRTNHVMTLWLSAFQIKYNACIMGQGDQYILHKT